MLSQLPAELRAAAVAVMPAAFTGQAADFRVQFSDCTLPQPNSRAQEPSQTATYSLVYRWGSASNVGSDASLKPLSETWFGFNSYCRLAVLQLSKACSMNQVYTS